MATNRQSKNKAAAKTTGHQKAKERPLYHANTPLEFLFPRCLSGAGATDGGPSPSPGVSNETSEKEDGAPPAANTLTKAGADAERAGSVGRRHASDSTAGDRVLARACRRARRRRWV